MTNRPSVPTDPDLRGVPDALLRAAERARRLAEQMGTPFIVRQPVASEEIANTHGTDRAWLKQKNTEKQA
jgi:hypothetical protein